MSVPSGLEWIKTINRGDVLESKSGKLRIVRRVSHGGPSLPKTHVWLTIQKCSWTHRPYTMYNGNDLRQMGFNPTGVRVKLRGRFDREMDRQFDAQDSRDCTISCCEVTGIP